MAHLDKRYHWLVFVAVAGFTLLGFSGNGWGAWQEEWQQIVEAGKKEGKVVVSIPASSTLRKQMEATFEKRFPGINLELYPSRASKNLRRIQDEYKAGVHIFDVHIGGSGSMVSGFVGGHIVDPFRPYLIVPQVKDPKNWWGGYMSIDTDKKYVFTFAAFLTANFWYNTQLVNPAELTSYDGLLNPKLKGKIAWLDPRRPGAGRGVWEYMYANKGLDYLKQLVKQDLQLSRNQRVMAESLAKGKLAVTIGVSYYSFQNFVEAGLPVKALPLFKEGTYGTCGSGNLAVIKGHPHPNATKVFVNWLLDKEGQNVYTQAMSQATRRFDVDTKWVEKYGYIPAKDNITLAEWNKVEQITAAKQKKARKARKLSRQMLPK